MTYETEWMKKLDRERETTIANQRNTIECQRHTIGRLVQYLADAFAGYETSGIERRLNDLGLTWADAIPDEDAPVRSHVHQYAASDADSGKLLECGHFVTQREMAHDKDGDE